MGVPPRGVICPPPGVSFDTRLNCIYHLQWRGGGGGRGVEEGDPPPLLLKDRKKPGVNKDNMAIFSLLINAADYYLSTIPVD